MSEAIHMVYKLFKQVQKQQEVSFEGKSAQEKADLIVSMLDDTSEDHPIRTNIKKK